MIKKLFFLLLGNIFIGIGAATAVFCGLGIDPSTTFFIGMNNIFNLGLGNVTALGNLLLFIPMFIYDRSTIHIGTFVNMLGIGYVIQYFSLFLMNTFPDITLLTRVIVLLSAIFMVCLGAGLYLSCDLGQAPWDAVAHIINIILPKTKYSYVRMIQDLSALTIGFIFHSSIGIASFIFAFFLGPGIQFFKNFFKQRIFNVQDVQIENSIEC